MSIRRIFFFVLVAIAILLATGMPTTSSDLIVGRNVNMVSGTDFIGGDPYLQRQNEPSIAVSTRNPLHLLAGANDYRTIDIPFPHKLPGIPEGTAARDAWLGVFKSIDGGQSWTSTLLPGYPQDTSIEGTSSPIFGYDAACDPVVRAGTNGLFYYSGIAFNREEQGAGVVFVARFIDNNNIEAPETIEYIDTNFVDQGNAGQFLDMPSIAVDLPRDLTNTKTIITAGNLPQDIPCGNVYITYSVFLGNTVENVRSRILFARSTDCGLTWTKPIKLSESQHIIQRPKVAIDPSDPTGGTVYVAFRRFAHGKEPDAIVIVRSTDGGQTFTKPIEVAPINPFDQGTSIHSFRTNGYPTLTVDNNGIVYLAWSQRVGPLPQEEARIMLTTSTDGQNWPDPWVVDNSGIGHQFMPSLTCIGGKLMMAWYDQRNDIAIETNPSYFTKYIEDSLCRHTIDVRVAQADPGQNPVFGPARRVTRYLYILETDAKGDPIEEEPGGYWVVKQVQFNPPNYPLFQMGTVPFHGDYMEIASLMFLPTQGGGWTYNTDYSQASVFHTTWTDNRDVVPPNGNWWDDWTNYAQWPLYSRPNNEFEPDACINALNTGMRNQNVYTSAITEGIIVGSPGNSKQLDIERTFVVFVKNTTAEERSFRLMIDEPSGVSASFKQFEDMEELDVTIGPYSTISRTVYVNSSDRRASVTVNVDEINAPGGNPIGGLEGYVVLNPDPTNPDALDPNADPLYYEVHNPRVENPRVENYAVFDELNTNLINPRVENVDLINSGYISPRVENPRVENPRVENLNILNLEMANPRVENPRVENAALVDVVWTVANDGNTPSAYTFTLLHDEATVEGDFPGDLIEQVLIYKIHTTPAASVDDGCDLAEVHHDELVTVISNPRVENPRVENPRVENPRVENPRVENATVNLAPGEEALFVLRIYDEDITVGPTIEDVIGPEEDIKIGNAATAHAVDTEDVIAGETTPTVSYSANYTPAIGYSPSSMAFTASEGGANPVSQLLQIQNTGDGMLSYAITDDENWLEITPADGIVYPGDPANNHTVSVDISGKTEGTYNAEITIVGYGASNTPQTIPVVLTITSVGAPNKLVFIQHPSGGVGDIAWTTQPQVEVQDAAGNRITADNYTEVSLTINNNPSSGALSGTTSIIVNNGVAEFLGLSIDKGGYGYTLVASSPGLLPDTSEPFNIEGFSDTGSMKAERVFHTATFLVNDKVLIAGGAKTPFLQSAEIYYPTTGSFTNLGPVMTAERDEHTATVLLNDNVLITGGFGTPNTAEIFDPDDNSFSTTGTMNGDRLNHRATLLQDGRVLITGGPRPWGDTAEIYDPATGIFSLVADTMGEHRYLHTSTLLPNGKVLIAGGLDSHIIPVVVHDNAYLFNPATEEFTPIGTMLGGPRYGHTAILLDDGTVLIAGGDSGEGSGALDTALIYDPYDGPNGSFTLLGTNMNDGHSLHQAALLRDGKVLLMGYTAEIYDPDTQQFHVTGQMAKSRQAGAAAVLPDGLVLVTGGSKPVTNSAEIWNPIEPFPTHVISGTITYNSSGVGGVLLDGLPGYPITNYGGYYEGLVLDGWSGTVTPTLAGYNFSPSSETYTSVTSNQVTNYTAFPLLIFSTFDNDTVDLPPPTTGAPSHPTSIVQPVTGTINVKSASNGLTTQPVEINDGGNNNYYGSVDYTFSPFSTGIWCVEATVSINKLLPMYEYGYFLQTYVGISRVVVTRLSMFSNGRIIAGGTQVGTYQANTPFRVRKLVDMDTKTWSVVIDNEMNGFDDDLMFTDLSFTNDPILNVGGLGANLHSYNISGVTSIAYDDIFVGKI